MITIEKKTKKRKRKRRKRIRNGICEGIYIYFLEFAIGCRCQFLLRNAAEMTPSEPHHITSVIFFVFLFRTLTAPRTLNFLTDSFAFWLFKGGY